MNNYCSKCDLFIGYGALGVFQEPKDRNKEWKRNHCWGCERSREEILEQDTVKLDGDNRAR
jgi:hypothetical protein